MFFYLEVPNEITAVPKLIETLAVQGVVFAFDAINTQKND